MSYDLVVVGGGVVGLTLAALVAKSSLKVLVIEKKFQHSFSETYDLRCSAINLNSISIFKDLGVWEEILKIAKYGIFEKIAIYAQENKLEFDADEIYEPYLGYILQNQVIIQGLLSYLGGFSNVQLLSATVMSIDATKNCLYLNDNSIINYNLLAVSDGRFSWLRQLLGVDSSYYDYNDSAIVAVVRTSKSSANTASQFFGDDSILAFLPLAEPNIFSIVLSQNSASNQEIISNPEDLGMILGKKSAYTFGHVEVISKIANFELVAQHAKNYVIHDNIVLVGDSAHSIHPLAGQGLNLGLADVACLAKFINQKRTTYALLRKYERTVKLQNSIFLHSMTVIRKLFKTTWPVRFAMQTLRHSQALKAVFIKNAAHGL